MNELLKKFANWYYAGEYLGQATPITWMHSCYDLHTRDQLAKHIFEMGVIFARQQSLEILGDFELATLGLDPEMLTPDEVFERAAYNLKAYYDANS